MWPTAKVPDAGDVNVNLYGLPYLQIQTNLLYVWGVWKENNSLLASYLETVFKLFTEILFYVQ
jgi:hypothetical protein